MKVAIEGCCHGELDQIYATLKQLEEREHVKVDLLLICGDFQAVRNEHDLESMAVPAKHRKMQTFHKYYSGESVAPVLTVLIGGNHEAANHLWELPFGGWVATNIYYVGFASILTYGGLRFGGLSGIYKRGDYMKGHYERPPFDQGTVRSFYHIREVDVFRLKQIQQPVDMFMSHDWPNGIVHHGNLDRLLSQKPYFREDIDRGELGSAPAMELLSVMRPLYWFSAHLHVKFSALIRHDASTGGDEQPAITKFLALDKCLPRRDFLQIIDFPDAQGEKKLCYDTEWLCILRKTASLDQCSPAYQCMPSKDLWQFQPLPREMESLQNTLDLTVPENFCQTAPVHQHGQRHPPPAIDENPQSRMFCSKLGISNIQGTFAGSGSGSGSAQLPTNTTAPTKVANNDEIDLDDDDDDDENTEQVAQSACASSTSEGGVGDTRMDIATGENTGSQSETGACTDGSKLDGDEGMIGPLPRPTTSLISTISTSVLCSTSTAAATISTESVSSSTAVTEGASPTDLSSESRLTAASSPTPRRSMLVLPAPSAVSSCSDAVPRGDGQSQDTSVSPMSGSLDSTASPSEAIGVSDSSHQPVAPSGPRVLKRRNYAIYASRDDDDSDSNSNDGDGDGQCLEQSSKRDKRL